jgi:hypothetical protein
MPDDGSLTVVILLTLRDIYRANVSIARVKRPLKRRILSLLAVIASVSFLFYLVMARSDPEYSPLRALVLGTGLALALELILWPVNLVFIHGASYYAARNMLRSKPSAAGPITYEFSQTGASYSGPTGHGHLDWTSFVRIQETSEQFLLYPQKRLANVIPKRAFQSDSDVQHFRQLVRDFFRGEADLLV